MLQRLPNCFFDSRMQRIPLPISLIASRCFSHYARNISLHSASFHVHSALPQQHHCHPISPHILSYSTGGIYTILKIRASTYHLRRSTMADGTPYSITTSAIHTRSFLPSHHRSPMQISLRSKSFVVEDDLSCMKLA